MKKTTVCLFIAICIIMLSFAACVSENNTSQEIVSLDISDDIISSSEEISALSEDTQSSDMSEDTESSDMSEDSYIDIGDAYYSYNSLFSNTGAKTENFVVYDSESEISLFDGMEVYCKIHCSDYHAYTSFDIYKLGSEEDTKKYLKRFWLSNKAIDGKSPVCEGYNQIQMIWDLGITPEQVEELIGSYEEFIENLIKLDVYTEKEMLKFKAYYMGPESEMTDEDLDFIQMTWKNEFCVYTNKRFYTIDWLNEHSAEDYKQHNLPTQQLEEIYELKDNGYTFVEFLGERIKEYKVLKK